MQDAHHWVLKILLTFNEPSSDEPCQAKKFSKNLLMQFRVTQTDRYMWTRKYFEKWSEEKPDLPEATAAVVFYRCVQAHEREFLRQCGSQKVDTTLTCSQRLEEIVIAMRNLAIIRFDICQKRGLDELVANSKIRAYRKESNSRGNTKKRNDGVENDDEAAGGEEQRSSTRIAASKRNMKKQSSVR